jgi:hypothetical protein
MVTRFWKNAPPLVSVRPVLTLRQSQVAGRSLGASVSAGSGLTMCGSTVASSALLVDAG